jgi:PAS domain S-box-containing protein
MSREIRHFEGFVKVSRGRTDKMSEEISAPARHRRLPSRYMPNRPDSFRGLHVALEFPGHRWLLTFVLATAFSTAQAQIQRFDAAPPGVLEAGAPPFAVFSSDALGLSSPPTDLHQMPDGRLLLYAAGQIVLGDGVRWEVFHQSPEAKTLSTTGVAVDSTGHIFTSFRGGFSQIKFGGDGFWRSTQVATWPSAENPNRPVPRSLIEVGNEWFWHSGSGSVIAWHPGENARIAGRANMVENIFQFQGQLYLSERTEGELYRLNGESMELVANVPTTSADNAVTCAKPYNAEAVLIGTYGNGLQLFDGRTMHPFRQSGILARGLRINDLCQTGGHFYAAAIENYGIVFFDHEGKIVQVLDRSLDHRLSRVKKLLSTPGGLIWGLLDDGVLRVEFPTRVSNFEPIIGSGVTNAHPFRFDSALWIMADGKIKRGAYDEDGRLQELVLDSPAHRYAYSFSAALGFPIAGTDHGAYFRNNSGWISFAPKSDNLRILDPTPRNGRWLYGARNEIGWLRPENGGVTIERIPIAGLGNVFNTVTDKTGTVWMELGNGRVGRIRMEHERLVTDVFDQKNGVPEGWAQVFQIDGIVGFNIADQILRFDEANRRFVPDPDFNLKFPGLTEIAGRPGLDAQGRVWIAANGTVQIFEKHHGAWQNIHERMPPGLRPYYFTFESNGIVWMDSDRHLARFDPSLPVASPLPLRAIITHVDLVTSNRTLFSVNQSLPPLDYSDNSLNFHFLAPGNPFAGPVTFEVMMEGAGNEWVSTGGTGSAVFNRLKEGNYILHVRPKSDGVIGKEASLAFSVRPPWYRSVFAYSIYVFSVIGMVSFGAWLITFLQRRENTRLEKLVALRTGELKESNLMLASQVEEIRMLSQAIAQSPVGVIIVTPDDTIVFANPRAAQLTGYQVGELIGRNTRMLRSDDVSPVVLNEIATTVQRGESWHGQLANRRKDGATAQVRTTISPIRSPDGKIGLHLILEEDISEWLADQERRRRLEAQLFQSQKLESVGTLAGGIAHDFNNILTGILGYCELARFNAGKDTELMSQLQEIRTAGLRAKDLVAQILTFSRRGTAELVPLDLALPVAEALRLIRASTPATVAISSELQNGIVRADSTQIQQVVLNLCTNAVHAIGDQPGHIQVSLKRVQVDAQLAAEIRDLTAGPFLRLTVADNGHGMTPATLDRIFDPFFTTKQQGEGTGLGLSIVQGILSGHHGALRVRSSPESGSVFDLFFPISNESARASTPPSPAPRGRMQEILVVDDESAVAAFVTARLQQLGYRVAAFRDPREALAAHQQNPSRFQAIVTDLTMPHLTGIELIQRIRALGHDIPAVIITGYGRDAGGAKLAALPVCEVLYKPFGGEELARTLNSVMEGRKSVAT